MSENIAQKIAKMEQRRNESRPVKGVPGRPQWDFDNMTLSRRRASKSNDVQNVQKPGG